MNEDDPPAPGLANRLVTLRERRGFDQSEFAGMAGKSLRTIQGWESGKVTPPRREVARLGRIFGVDSGWLWTGEGTPPPWAGASPQHDIRELLGSFRESIGTADVDEFDVLVKQLLSTDLHPPGERDEGPDHVPD